MSDLDMFYEVATQLADGYVKAFRQAYNMGWGHASEAKASEARMYKHDADCLQAENAKLRELVRHLYECAKHNTCAVCDYAEDACDFKYDMRELGIEVDE